MQRQASRSACCPDFGGDLAIDMDLPVKRGQRHEVIAGDAVEVRLYPRQPITAVHLARTTLAEGAPAIIYPRLARYCGTRTVASAQT